MNYMCDSCVNSPPDDVKCAGCVPDDPTRSNYQAMRAYGGDKYQDAAVQCPFYKHHDRKKIIICEGPVKKTSVTLRFYKRSDLQRYVKDKCESEYRSCPIFLETDKKYETER